MSQLSVVNIEWTMAHVSVESTLKLDDVLVRQLSNVDIQRRLIRTLSVGLKVQLAGLAIGSSNHLNRKLLT